MSYEITGQRLGSSLTLHAFASVKGGVGKSSLAVAAAHLLARDKERKVVIIDCDLTGSSLADGLRLRAPDMPRSEQGSINLLSSPDEGSLPYLTLEKTAKGIDERMAAEAKALPVGVPFFNDALSFEESSPGKDCNVAAMLWCDDINERVLYFPSSPMREDIRLALAWLYQVEPLIWTRRFAWILERIARTVKGVTDILIDLPPGLFGFSESVLALLAALSQKEPLPDGFPLLQVAGTVPQVNAFIVSTPDLNDLFAAVRSYGRLSARLVGARLVVNRDQFKEATRREVRQRFPVSGVEELLYHLPFNEGLGSLFRERRIRIDEDSFWQQAVEVLRLEETHGSV